jgi:hypothetical protein
MLTVKTDEETSPVLSFHTVLPSIDWHIAVDLVSITAESAIASKSSVTTGTITAVIAEWRTEARTIATAITAAIACSITAAAAAITGSIPVEGISAV